MNYKLSQYNVSENIDGNLYVFNTISGKFGLFPDILNEEQMFDRIDKNLLYKNGYIINEHINELDLVKDIFYKSKYNRTLNFTIAITLECNFACKYCFVEEKTGTMSIETSENIVKFIEQRIKESGIEQVNVSFTGGEPLLAKDLLVSFVNSINSNIINGKNDVKVTYDIATNGSLLNSENLKFLESIGIDVLVITIDGPEHIHNTRRPFKKGLDSYKVLEKNIRRALEYNFLILIQTIFDDSIIKKIDIKNWADDLYARFGNNVKIRYFFTHTSFKNKGKKCINKSASKFIFDVLNVFLERGLSIFIYDIAKSPRGLCSGCSNNSYSINYDGSIYVCFHDIMNKQYLEKMKIGNVSEMKINSRKQTCLTAFYPFDEKQCSQCNLLPMCMGGCKWYKLTGNKKCLYWKNNTKQWLSFLKKIIDNENKNY